MGCLDFSEVIFFRRAKPTTTTAMRKIIFFLSVLLLITSGINGQQDQWAWMKGDNSQVTIDFAAPVYGQIGVPDDGNRPGKRISASTWTALDGTLWLFGGLGEATDGNGNLNDLWKYNPATNQWTWIKGDKIKDQIGVYGTVNVGNVNNKPGARIGAVTWTDAAGNFWLFGGSGNGNSTSGGLLNDLWRYNIASNKWTWVKGDQTANNIGVYGAINSISASNKPGGRYLSGGGWIDATGRLYLFGGWGRGITTTTGRLNDLWRYDTTSKIWTWIKGNNTLNNLGVYGTINNPLPANNPGSRDKMVTWTDNNGKFWFFGGEGYHSTSSDQYLNDVWKFDPTVGNWSWMKGSNTFNLEGTYGTITVAASANTPGARNSSSGWKDSNGDLWIFGGYGRGGPFTSPGPLQDLWKFNTTTLNWTWMNGSQFTYELGHYGIQGVPDANNYPGSRKECSSWADANGNFWLFGGQGYGNDFSSGGFFNELWKINPADNKWTWIRDQNMVSTFTGGIYGTKGVSAANNNPGGRVGSISWNRSDKYLWLFGGHGGATSGSGYLNDLWKFDSTNSLWTWVGGDSVTNKKGIYGSLGVAAAANNPGSRSSSVTWIDGSENFWLFGGIGYGNSGLGSLNDLWKYDKTLSQWIWISGDSAVNKTGAYGAIGTPSVNNKPGGRQGAVSFFDASGNLWLMGGYGLANGSTAGYLNDLWKYNPGTKEWTWIKGPNTIGNMGVYGTQGTPDLLNNPSCREGGIGWVDDANHFWLFGGQQNPSSDSYLNDLWEYNIVTNQWTWIKGNSAVNYTGVYGTKKISSASNTPGSRSALTGWKDNSNNLWLFGGSGFDFETLGTLNDLWKYNITTNQWAWMNGENTVNSNGEYGTQGIPDPLNTPGARFGTRGWATQGGKRFWLFGGSNFFNFNEIWKYNVPCSGNVILSPSSGTVCFDGSPFLLTASGGSLYTWYKDGNIISGVTGSTYSATTFGKYVVKTNVGSCADVYSNEVIIQAPTVTPSLGGKGVYCENAPVNIGMPDTQNDQTYQWLGGGESRYIPIGGGGGNQSLNFAMKATSGGIYYVESTKPGCNTVQSNSQAVYFGGVTDLVTTSLCPNSVSFEWKDYGSPIKKFQYVVSTVGFAPSSGITVSATSASASSLLPGTTYYIHVRGASVPNMDISLLSFCSDWTTLEFQTPPAFTTPVLTPVSATLCQGKSQLLTATGGSTYTWTRNGSTIPGESSSTYLTSLSGTYRVTAVISGCSQTSAQSNASTIAIIPAPTSTTSIAVCNSQLPFLWNGISCPSEGTYTKTLSTAAGCDSIATLILSLAPPKTSTTNANICSNLLPYVWNGTNYNATGVYTKTLTASDGCDSIATLNLTVKPIATSTTNASVCANLLPYIWNGTNYNATGVYTKTFVASNGCDSIATLNLTVKPIATSTTNAGVCANLLPYVWNGTNYAASGVYTKTLMASNGCDSIATLNLTIKPVSASTTNVAICTNQLPYTWNGNTYTAAGSYTVILIAANGCDSVARLNLTVNAVLTSTTNITICTNQLPYVWNGNNYTATGIYNVTLLSISGCDSIATLNLTVSAGLTSTTTVSVCSNQLPYVWNGNNYTTTGVYSFALITAAGCDSVATLNLTVRPISTSTTNISRCANQLPYNWNGINYTTTGVYTAILINSVGCDSVATLNFAVKPVLTSITNVSICTNQLPYTWNGNTYSGGGTYIKTLTGSNGCDSIATLILSVNTVLTSTTNAAVCANQLPYAWNGNNYTSTGTYSVTLQSTSGCDSIATLNLTVRSVLTSTTNANTCVNRLPYIWNGNNYSVAGTFTVTLTGSNGCDSVATLNLLINPVLSSTTSVTACTNQLPYNWNGNSYTSSGVYSVTLVSSAGCDSVATLNLTINTVLTSTTNVSLCTNQLPYSWNGNSYTASGVYTVTLISSANCDSVATLNLSVNTVLTSTTNIAVCNNQLPYSWNGNNYSTAGTYNVTLTSIAGCDSIATLNLIIKTVSASATNAIICSNQLPYTWNGNTYTAAGTFAVTLIGSNSCDSVATLNLTVNPVRSSTTNVAICSNQLPYVWNGNNYTASGNYSVTLISSLNCDSIATLHLSINPVLASITNVSVCTNQLPYHWNGNNYTTAGTYTVTLVSSANCDSLATLNLTITAALTSTTNAVICSNQLPYVWNGNNYTASGTYTATLTGSNNCDSIAKLILTVNSVLTSATNASVCVNRLPYVWNGNNYTASGTYTVTLTGSNNCDSVATLRLTVNPLSSSITNASVCINRLPYNWNGNNYSSAGTYTVVLVSSVNCDSIATLNLTVNPVVTSTTNVTICANQLPYNWNGNRYNAAGIYTLTLVSAANCDSLATLMLAVTPLPTGTITPASATICTGSSKILTATGGTSYQWLLNGSPIPGASTSATYTATQSGVYSVIITNNNCSAPASNSSTIIVAPVPTGVISPVNTTICPGSSQLLTATGGVSYQWYLNSIAINGAVTDTYSATTAGVYSVEIFNVNGCKGTALNNAGIIHYSKPVPAFSFDVFCQNQPISFFNTSSTVNSGGANYTWNFGDNTSSALFAPIHTYSEAKSFTVTLIATSTACPLLSDSIKKAVAITAAIPGIKYPPARVIKNTAFTLTARSIGQQYAWNPSFGLSNANIYNPVVTTAADISYTIKITSTGGCITVDTLLVQAFDKSEVFVPKAFTPNGNNANDLLRPVAVNIPDIKYFRVYNRWGQLVFQTNTAGEGWNGIYKNVPQPMETYTWIFEGTDANGTVIKASGKTLLIR